MYLQISAAITIASFRMFSSLQQEILYPLATIVLSLLAPALLIFLSPQCPYSALSYE